MKKGTTYICVLICCVIAGNSIHAQDSMGYLPENTTAYASSHTNRQPVSDNGKPIYLNDINIKAVADFKTRFKDVDDERWQKQANGGFVAVFKKNDTRHIVWYSSRGKWESTLKGYNESVMPFEVRDIVKRTYYDYSITHVDEIETYNGGPAPTYLVYMQFKNLVKIIRVKNGEMDIYRELTKQ